MLDPQKIARLTQETQTDPHNELAFFALGRAYLEGDCHREAIAPLLRALQLNTQLSQGYVLLAEAQRGAGDVEGAVVTLQQGHKVASQRGDLMPRNQMADLLKEMGRPIPEPKAVAALTPELAAVGNIQCRRCGQVAPRMKERPFGGALGEQIHQSICGPCFRQWIGQGTKVINEFRLNLTEKTAQDVYDDHMKAFLNLV